MVAVGRSGPPVVAGVVGSGLAQQPLSKVVSADYAVGWGTPPATWPGAVLQSVNWYDNRTAPVSSGSNVTVAAATGIYVPVQLVTPIDVSGLAVTTVSVNGSSVSLAMLSAGANGLPGSLLGSLSLTSTSTTLAQVATTATPFRVGRGWNWLFVGNLGGSSFTVAGCSAANVGTGWPLGHGGSPGTTVYSFCTETGNGGNPRSTPTVTLTAGSTPVVWFYVV